jgi:hypothetical protein
LTCGIVFTSMNESRSVVATRPRVATWSGEAIPGIKYTCANTMRQATSVSTDVFSSRWYLTLTLYFSPPAAGSATVSVLSSMPFTYPGVHMGAGLRKRGFRSCSFW